MISWRDQGGAFLQGAFLAKHPSLSFPSFSCSMYSLQRGKNNLSKMVDCELGPMCRSCHCLNAPSQPLCFLFVKTSPSQSLSSSCYLPSWIPSLFLILQTPLPASSYTQVAILELVLIPPNTPWLSQWSWLPRMGGLESSLSLERGRRLQLTSWAAQHLLQTDHREYLLSKGREVPALCNVQ